MKIMDLCGTWQVNGSDGRSFSGMVPGCVHTDLFNTEFLFQDKNSVLAQELEGLEWSFRKTFFCDAKDMIGAVLVFEGLDTYSTIYLNGVKIGETENMFIPYSFSVSEQLKQGENILEVRFDSPVERVKGMPEANAAFSSGRLNTRRIQCTYGWDWVDRFVTCGIYRPVYLEFHTQMRISDVYIYTSQIDTYGAEIRVMADLENVDEGGMVLTEILDDVGTCILSKHDYCRESFLGNVFCIENPKLWFPAGYGEQPLYTLRMTVGEEVYECKFGIRTVRILQLTDDDHSDAKRRSQALRNTESGIEYDQNETSSGFILLINGEKVFCTGANWVPCEPFPSAETPEKITKCLTLAKESGINMIRIWGGGIFEKRHFYEECDRLGIMVTQDFLMACGTYPEQEEWFCQNLALEAEFAAKYLRNFACLVWWTGDNENAIHGSDMDSDYPGRISARKIIAPILAKYDFTRQFLYSSPYGGKTYASKTVGTTHNTQFLNYFFDYITKSDETFGTYYEAYTARFIAEEPVMGAVSRMSLKKFISEEFLEDEDMWLYHTKTNPYLELHLFEYIKILAQKLFGAFQNADDKAFKLRYLQYEWVRVSLGLARKNMWYNSGIVYWMLNDCWPAAAGWSLIDYYNMPKAGLYAVRQLSDAICVIADAEAVYVSNRAKPTEGELSVWIPDGNSKKLLLQKEQIFADGVTKIPVFAELIEEAVFIAELKTGEKRMRSFYKKGCLNLEPCALKYSVFENHITLSADTYIHAVELTGATDFSENYFSLLPGETKTVRFQNSIESVTASAYSSGS